MRISPPILLAAAMLAVLGSGARADTSNDGRATLIRGRTVIHYGDLNIESEQDAKILLQRIALAAKKACGGQPTFSTYTGSLDHSFEECRREAIERTVKRLGSPLVTRVHSEAAPRESRLHRSG